MAPRLEELATFRKRFLPAANGASTTPNGGAAPQATNQVIHPLNQYAFNLIHLVEKDYDDQVAVWSGAFADVVGSLASAISRKNDVYKAAERERQSDAAFHAMILSFLAIGPLSFLGAYVEHALVPSLTKMVLRNDPLIMGLNTGSPFVVKSTKLVTVQRFSALQADAFGGIAQGAGTQLVTLAFPAPANVTFGLDSAGGIELMRNQFLKFVADCAKVVKGQFTNVQTWLTLSNEFGEAWSKAGGPDPKATIRLHFDKLRKDWATQWIFFGKKPAPIATPLLTDTIERALWAGHLIRLFSNPRFTAEPDAMTMAEGFGESVGGKALENVVVERLKALNVVLAETEGGQIGQWVRVANAGAPMPNVKVEDEVDTRSEVGRLKAWAENYLNTLDKEAQLRFFPPASPRPIEPIRYL